MHIDYMLHSSRVFIAMTPSSRDATHTYGTPTSNGFSSSPELKSCVEEPIKTEIAPSETTDKRTRVNKCCDVFLYKFDCLKEVAHAPKPTFTVNGI